MTDDKIDLGRQLKLTEVEYHNAQQKLSLVVGFVKGFNEVTDLLGALEHADSVGAILSPTLYRAAMGKVALVMRHANAIAKCRLAIMEADLEFLEKHPDSKGAAGAMLGLPVAETD